MEKAQRLQEGIRRHGVPETTAERLTAAAVSTSHHAFRAFREWCSRRGRRPRTVSENCAKRGLLSEKVRQQDGRVGKTVSLAGG